MEPYVVAADVYAVSPHTGRGGWTWYTGSAGWMYRLIVESLLGLKLEVDKLRLLRVSRGLEGVHGALSISRNGLPHHRPANARGNGEMSVTVDGVEQHDKAIPLVDDRQEHSVEVKIQAAAHSVSVTAFANIRKRCVSQPRVIPLDRALHGV